MDLYYKNLFGNMIKFVFKSVFWLKIYQNNIFIIFFTSTHQNNKSNIYIYIYIYVYIYIYIYIIWS